MASTIIKHDYGAPYLHTSYHGIRNCSFQRTHFQSEIQSIYNSLGTIERYCNEDGTWSDTISPEIQCKVCPVDAEPVKVCFIINVKLLLVVFSLQICCLIVQFYQHHY